MRSSKRDPAVVMRARGETPDDDVSKTLDDPAEIVNGSIYKTSPVKVKRKRRTKEELWAILEATQSIIEEYTPHRFNIRHLYYRLSVDQFIEKTHSEYKKVCSYTAKWRRQGFIPYNAFSDSTRFYVGPEMFSHVEQALRNTADNYRNNLWQTQPAHVEIWTEKDAIRAILARAASPRGVRTFICRGFGSLTGIYECCMEWKELQKAGKCIYVYLFGDHDPSGLAVDQAIKKSIANDFSMVDIHYQRMAVTSEQIKQYDLPTKPPKTSDSRRKHFEGETVEIDAMRPTLLADLVEKCITRHIEPLKCEQMQIIEEAERVSLTELMHLRGGDA